MKRKTDTTDQAAAFVLVWRALAPEYAHLDARHAGHALGEYQFHEGRRWRFDWCIPALKVAVEVDGGNLMCRRTRTGRYIAVGGHTQDADYRKLNAATLDGWRVLRFTTTMLRDPERCVAQVKRVVRNVLQYYEEQSRAKNR